jgi:hypothetical protein
MKLVFGHWARPDSVSACESLVNENEILPVHDKSAALRVEMMLMIGT